MANRVVLAYSGGLDTSVAVRWITDEWGAEVIALAADVGQARSEQDGDFEAIRQRALAAGAVDAKVVDLREEFATEYFLPRCARNIVKSVTAGSERMQTTNTSRLPAIFGTMLMILMSSPDSRARLSWMRSTR